MKARNDIELQLKELEARPRPRLLIGSMAGQWLAIQGAIDALRWVLEMPDLDRSEKK